MQISQKVALKKLSDSKQLFLELFRHGTLSVEVYKPFEKDLQQSHEQDEVYLVISGEGDFYSDGKTVKFQKGDFLFVPAGVEHRFENFSDDFSTWVIFYGVKGGEANNSMISP
jgi:mannose-6-phosphate isomerase-like protein (cupin superfamily)